MHETRKKILETAFKLFLEKGYDKVSMNEIIRKADVSKGGFYYHFKSKENLYKETIENYFLFYFNSSTPEIKPEASLKEQVLTVCEYYIKPFKDVRKILDTQHQTLNYYLLLIQSAQKYSKIRKRLNEFTRQKEAHLSEIIQNAREKNEIKNWVNANTTAKHILYLLEGTLYAAIIENKLNISNNYQKVVDHFLSKILIT